MALAGAALILLRSRQRFLRYFCLFLMPVLTMIPFNLLELWPFGPLRMNLFLMTYVVFPPLFLLDEWQRRQPMAGRFLPVGLVVALLMALQFPTGWRDYARQRVVMQNSAEALAAITDYQPDHPPIPLLINRAGMPSFSYYSRHHKAMSERFHASSENFSPPQRSNPDSLLYTTGLLLRQCQKHRQVAVYASFYQPMDRVLFRNDFSVGHHSFDGNKVHSCILESEIAGYEDKHQPLFATKRFTGKSDHWQAVYKSPPLPITNPLPGSLVVVNFDLKFTSREKLIRFRFLDQDGSRDPFDRSTTQNETPRIPARIESAVYTKIQKPVDSVRLVIEANGTYDFLMKNVTCFMTRTEAPKPTIGPSVYQIQAGDRARVYGAMTSLDGFWPDNTLSYGWTMGDTTITLDDLAVDPEESVLLLETFGWMPPLWRKEMNRNGLRFYVNGDRRARFLGRGPEPVKHYYFEIPPDVSTIDSIRILSNAFSPRELGLNDDQRHLGLDVRSIQFPAKKR